MWIVCVKSGVVMKSSAFAQTAVSVWGPGTSVCSVVT
jgi:hypothetical protein